MGKKKRNKPNDDGAMLDRSISKIASRMATTATGKSSVTATTYRGLRSVLSEAQRMSALPLQASVLSRAHRRLEKAGHRPAEWPGALLRLAVDLPDPKRTSIWSRAVEYAASKRWTPQRFELELYRQGIRALAAKRASARRKRGPEAN